MIVTALFMLTKIDVLDDVLDEHKNANKMTL